MRRIIFTILFLGTALHGLSQALQRNVYTTSATPALNGDITTPGNSLSTTLATVNGNVGIFGDGTHVAQVTLDAKGRVTAASSVAITAGSGTVTSVGLAAPVEFTVSGSPVVGAGTLTFTKANQNANLFYAGPGSGVPAAPTFRAMVSLDIPNGIVANASLVNSSVTLNGTANQITVSGGGPLSLGGTATLSIPNPFIAPGVGSFSGITNTGDAPNQFKITDGAKGETTTLNLGTGTNANSAWTGRDPWFTTKTYVIDGIDSLAAGTAINGQSFPFFLANYFLTNVAQFVGETNCGVAGRTSADVLSKWDTELGPLVTNLVAGGTNVIFNHWGAANDVAGGATALAINGTLSNLFLKFKNAGGRKICCLTITDSTNYSPHAPQNLVRYQVNHWIKTNQYVDAVVDVSAKEPLWNTVNYVDGVHFTTNTEFKIAGMIWNAYNQPPRTIYPDQWSDLFELTQGTVPAATNPPIAGQVYTATSTESAAWKFLNYVDTIDIPLASWYTNNEVVTPSSAATPVAITNMSSGWLFANAISNEIHFSFSMPAGWDLSPLRLRLKSMSLGTNSIFTTNVTYRVGAYCLPPVTPYGNNLTPTFVFCTNNVPSGTGNALAMGQSCVTTDLSPAGTLAQTNTIFLSIRREGGQVIREATNQVCLVDDVLIYYNRTNLLAMPTPTP